MSLDKAIEHGKEKRKPYHKSKAFDQSCRNHGSCSYCQENRTFQSKKSLDKIIAQEKDLYCSCYLDNLVSGLMTNGEQVSVEEWNNEIDQRDESRRIDLLEKELSNYEIEITSSYIKAIYNFVDNKNQETHQNMDNAFQDVLKFYSEKK